MKKLVLLLAVAFSVSLFSCGGDKKAEEAAADTAAVVEEVAVVTEEVATPCDSCTNDSCNAEAAAPAAETTAE